MMLASTVELEAFTAVPIPATVAIMMSAMEAGSFVQEERRQTGRNSYRTTTHLRLFRDDPSSTGWLLYTRDINRRGVGFITPHRLPLGYGATIVLPDEQGNARQLHCTLSRCREACTGWFEGSLHFNREQPHFHRK